MTCLDVFEGKTPWAAKTAPHELRADGTLLYLDIELDWRTHRVAAAVPFIFQPWT